MKMSKISLALLALILVIGIGTGITIAQSNDDDPAGGMMLYLGNAGNEYVTLTPTQEWWDSGKDNGQHAFVLDNGYPGFGHDTNDSFYALYFVHNGEIESGNPKEVSSISVTPSVAWIEAGTWGEDEIPAAIKTAVLSRIDALTTPSSTDVKNAIKGCLGADTTGDGLELYDPIASGLQTDSSTWGCVAIWVKIPFESGLITVPQNAAATVEVDFEFQDVNGDR